MFGWGSRGLQQATLSGHPAADVAHASGTGASCPNAPELYAAAT